MTAANLMPAQARLAAPVGRWLPWVLALMVAALHLVFLFAPNTSPALTTVPQIVQLPVADWLGQWVNAISDLLKPALRPPADGLDTAIKIVEQYLRDAPWPVLTVLVMLIAARAASVRLALYAGLSLVLVAYSGYWAQTVRTLTLVLFALPGAVLMGLLLGVLADRSRVLAWALDAFLSFIQTVPAFAYLVPLVVVFGFGPVPGVIASVLYAAPAMARNVQMGLSLVPSAAVEAGTMSGCTPLQLFFLVRLPCASRQLFVGLNQTIMACLSMVIFAAAIGGFEDLGWEVLRAARKADFGNGLVAGSIITVIAVLADRISAGQGRELTRRQRLAWIVAGGVGCLALWAISAAFDVSSPSDAYRALISAWIDARLQSVIAQIQPVTDGIREALTRTLLLPLRVGLARTLPRDLIGESTLMVLPAVSLLIALGFTAWAQLRWRRGVEAAFVAMILYNGLVTFPWPVFMAMAVWLTYRRAGGALAFKAALIWLFIACTGMWISAMYALYYCVAAMVVCVLVGTSVGVLAARSAVLSTLMRPINDVLQTIPPFVILIPVITFFGVGDFSSFVAIVAYAIAATLRYTEHALRSVPVTIAEAGVMAGCTRLQMLFMVQLPAAAPQIRMSLSQTFMYCLSMLAVAALVGARGLGQDVYIALGKADPGLGLLAGGVIALLAILMNDLLAARDTSR